MRSFQLRLAYTFLRTQIFLQIRLYRRSFLSNPSSTTCSLVLHLLQVMLLSLTHLVVPLILVKREGKAKPTSRLCCILGSLMFQLTMRISERTCKECNWELVSWRRYVKRCKRRWQKYQSQEHQGMVIQNPCPSSVHDSDFED